MSHSHEISTWKCVPCGISQTIIFLQISCEEMDGPSLRNLWIQSPRYLWEWNRRIFKELIPVAFILVSLNIILWTSKYLGQNFYFFLFYDKLFIISSQQGWVNNFFLQYLTIQTYHWGAFTYYVFTFSLTFNPFLPFFSCYPSQ